MPWVCDECQQGRHGNCRSEWKCDCKCRVGCFADVVQKGLACTAGIGVGVGGIALTVATGGLAALLIGGVMAGAGISSAWNGTEKVIKRERINGKSYAWNVVFGAATGLVTGGMGVGGEAIATNVVKSSATEFAKVGAQKLALRTAAGAVSGVAAKTIDEVKECSTTDKKWKDFGKSFNSNGEENGTAVAWICSIATGGLGGASSHLSSNLTKLWETGIEKSITRVVVSTATAAASDASAQGLNIAVGNQEEYDLKRTLTSATASAITTAAQEGTKNAIYRANGGKDNMHHEGSNKKAIEKNVPPEQQQNVMDAHERLNQISPETLTDEYNKATTFTKCQKDKIAYQSEMKDLNEKIDVANSNRRAEYKNENFEVAKKYDNEFQVLMQEKHNMRENFKNQSPTIKKSEVGMMNQDNAHYLTIDKLGQVVVDIKSPDTDTRGAIRATFDYDTKGERPQFKFSGYTDKHDYNSTPSYGKSDYYKYREDYTKYSQCTDGVVNNYVPSDTTPFEKKKKKKLTTK